MSETEVNTDRVVTTSTSMRHTEGGWPKDVDVTEQSDVTRFRKKAEKDESYQNAIKTLGPIVERCMKQNNTVDIYEQYFKNDNTEDLSSEPPSAKGLAVFRDPSPIQRSVSSINWHPEANSSKIAVSYSIPRFQDERFKDPQLSLSVSVLYISRIYVLALHSIVLYPVYSCPCMLSGSPIFGILITPIGPLLN